MAKKNFFKGFHTHVPTKVGLGILSLAVIVGGAFLATSYNSQQHTLNSNADFGTTPSLPPSLNAESDSSNNWEKIGYISPSVAAGPYGIKVWGCRLKVNDHSEIIKGKFVVQGHAKYPQEYVMFILDLKAHAQNSGILHQTQGSPKDETLILNLYNVDPNQNNYIWFLGGYGKAGAIQSGGWLFGWRADGINAC